MTNVADAQISSDEVTLQQLSIKPSREYDKFRSFIDLNELDSEMETGTLHGLNRYISNNYKSWNKEKLIIGVAGNSGAGKSSLINALRGLKSQDRGAAPVGNTVTTINVVEYPFPGNARIILRDFPGVGSPYFPKEDYLEKTKLLNSDVVIVVSSGRFTENDSWIAKQVIEKQRNVLFVRTKVDIDLYNSRVDYPDTFDEYSCLSMIREDMETNIKLADMDLSTFREDIYLISLRHRSYDLDKLVGTLKCLLNKENNAICQLLFEHLQKTIKPKTRQTEKEFFGKKIVSVLAGFLSTPFLTLESVGEMIQDCKRKYCIDEGSLDELANELKHSKEDLKGILNGEETSEVERLHPVTYDKKWEYLQKYFKYVILGRLIPGFGSVFPAYNSPCTIFFCLEQKCREMAEVEWLMLVRLRLEKLRKDLIVLKQ